MTPRRARHVCRREQTPRLPQTYDRPWVAKEIIMLSTLIVVLVALWLLGFATSYTLGGLIHILLVVAVIVVLLRVIQGRNPMKG
jgi:predicted ferric reductase